MEIRAKTDKEQGGTNPHFGTGEPTGDAPDDIRADAEKRLDRLGGYFSLPDCDMPLEKAYRDAIGLAAAIERLMDARGIGYV